MDQPSALDRRLPSASLSTGNPLTASPAVFLVIEPPPPTFLKADSWPAKPDSNTQPPKDVFLTLFIGSIGHENEPDNAGSSPG